jgi:hypothetical protein
VILAYLIGEGVFAKPTPVPLPVPTASPTLPRKEARVRNVTSIVEGPNGTGFKTVLQLPKDAVVKPLGIYGDFLKVEFQIGGIAKEGYILAILIDDIPSDLPQLTQQQVPWLVFKNYTEYGPLGYSNPNASWTSQTIDRNIIVSGPFRLQINQIGEGFGNWVNLYGREAQRQSNRWWEGIIRFEVGMTDAGRGQIGIILRDGTNEQNPYHYLFRKPQDGIVVFQFNQQGKQIVIMNATLQVIKIIDVAQVGNFADGLFPEGIKHIELQSSQGTMTVSQLLLLVPPSGK